MLTYNNTNNSVRDYLGIWNNDVVSNCCCSTIFILSKNQILERKKKFIQKKNPTKFDQKTEKKMNNKTFCIMIITVTITF